MIEVLEVDQWTATGDVTSFTWEECLAGKALGRVRGGDAEAAAHIFGGQIDVKHVEENARPILGSVWFVRGEDGHPKLWKTNYDSSD